MGQKLSLVLPADHLIEDTAKFGVAVKQAATLASQGYLVTFGIQPTGPETGFGYLQAGKALGGSADAAWRVNQFVEKPDLKTAQEYIASGNYYWNSGMFCFKASAVLKEMAQSAPEISVSAGNCWQEMKQEINAAQNLATAMVEIPGKAFAKAPDISIDYAVIEQSANVAMVAADIGWSDIGSWNAIKDLVAPDTHNNRSIGDSIFVDSNNTFVQSEGRLVAAVGVNNLMIIDTADALLVAHTDQAQQVKQVVQRLKSEQHEAYKLHRTVARPWGTYTVLGEGPRFKIKRIEVKPGASLSLQMHHHRSEHWIVVSGTARVVNGSSEIMVGANESTYIHAGKKHRLENPGVLDLVMIEVQSGEYLGEDDIVRFDDHYGRS
jgi:mannose-1-phosphate guanylyltransferase / mannose-6-phosphate isomerase